MKPLKDYWKHALEYKGVTNACERLTEQDVIMLLQEPCMELRTVQPGNGRCWSPWEKAFTPENIKSTFYSTGVWPVDFDKVRMSYACEQMVNAMLMFSQHMDAGEE